MFRVLGALLLLSALFVAVAAPTGGFGGGRSFGGGGRSFGGGSRSFGGGSRSFGGGSRSFGGRSTPFAPPMGGYGGGRYPWRGGGRGMPLPVVLGTAGGVGALIGGIALAGYLAGRFTIYTLALNLRRGSRYAAKLDELVPQADFTSARGRATALHRIAKLVNQEDVVDGYAVRVRSPGNQLKCGERAEALARAHIERVGITPEAVNVVTGEGEAVRLDPDAPASAVGPSDGCVLAITLTLRHADAKALRAGSQAEAIAALSTLAGLPGNKFDAFYVYYAPNASTPMDPISADRLFGDLRATVEQAGGER